MARAEISNIDRQIFPCSGTSDLGTGPGLDT